MSALGLIDRILLPVIRALWVALRKDSPSCCVVEEIEMLRVLKAA